MIRWLFSPFRRKRPDPFRVEPVRARGENLTHLATLYGIERGWWGFEPDFRLRKRILDAIRGPR